MNKNYKEYTTIMIHLLFNLLFVFSQTYAMNSKNDSGNVQPMQLCETTLFKRLMKSAWKNSIEDVRTLLSEHDLVSAMSATSWGTNPLGWAAHHGNVEMARLLLDKGFCLTMSEENATQLHTAAYHKHHEVLRLFLTYPFCRPSQTRVTTIKESLQKRIKTLSDSGLLIGVKGVSERMLAQELYEQSSFEDCAQLLAIKHFERLRPLLAARTVINYAPMTPYEAAYEHQETQCKDLLEPRGFEERLQEEVVQNYLEALKESAVKEN